MKGTPSDERERRGYLQRVMSVMLCCVLCAGLLSPRKAEAVAPAVVLIPAGVTALSFLGAMLVCGVGTDFSVSIEGKPSNTFGSPRAYVLGQSLMEDLRAAGSVCATWVDSMVQTITNAGGITSGMKFRVPTEVQKFSHEWVQAKFDFSAGPIEYRDHAIYLADGSVLPIGGFTDSYRTHVFDWNGVSSYPFTAVEAKQTSITDQEGAVWDYYAWHEHGTYFMRSSKDGRNMGGSQNQEPCIGRFTFVIVDYAGSYLLSTAYVISPTQAQFVYPGSIFRPEYFLSLPQTSVSTQDMVITKTGSLGQEATEEITLHVPQTGTSTKVDDLTVPLVGTLTQEMVLTGEVADTKPEVGDLPLDDVDVPGLGALFTTRFPFSIPWDMVRAVKLLAAPAQVPHFEVDFLAPISYRVGGWKGSTNIVLDFAQFEPLAALSRWVSTILFCAALISGTKKLIWS